MNNRTITNSDELAYMASKATDSWLSAIEARFHRQPRLAIIRGFLMWERGLSPEQVDRLPVSDLSLLLEERPCPRWDGASRSLHLGHHLLKQFKQPAQHQTRLLEVFAEDGWPDQIASPIPSCGGHQLDRIRLKDAVKGLNQKLCGLQFRLDGTGEGIRWIIRWADLLPPPRVKT